MAKNILFTRKVRKYQGTYIAVAAGRVVASGKHAREVFGLAKRLVAPRKVEGLYYIPRKSDLLTT